MASTGLLHPQVDEDLNVIDEALGALRAASGQQRQPKFNTNRPTIAEYTNNFQCVASIASQEPAACLCPR